MQAGNGTHYNSELFSMLFGGYGDHLRVELYHSTMHNSTAVLLFAQRRALEHQPEINKKHNIVNHPAPCSASATKINFWNRVRD